MYLNSQQQSNINFKALALWKILYNRESPMLMQVKIMILIKFFLMSLTSKSKVFCAPNIIHFIFNKTYLQSIFIDMNKMLAYYLWLLEKNYSWILWTIHICLHFLWINRTVHPSLSQNNVSSILPSNNNNTNSAALTIENCPTY